MTDYPTLSNMGITRFNEIRDYSLFTEKESDVLKIYYKRKEGSLLPRRKVFKFPKSTKPFTENDIDKNIRELRQISPTIRSAIAELDTILSEKKGKIDHKEAINRRLEQLEAEVQSNIAEIRSLLERI